MSIFMQKTRNISIHVPRVEDDEVGDVGKTSSEVFQSTSPVWRTTSTAKNKKQQIWISIHVPRVEDDLVIRVHHIHRGVFQSTSPVWRTT